MGGRNVRPQPGQIYDHFATVFDYASGAKLYANCRQIRGRGVHNNIGVEPLGTGGRGLISTRDDRHQLTMGDRTWRYEGDRNDHYQTEHDVLFASIRGGEPVNNGEYMCKSTMMAVMSRMSAYTGKAVTWDEAMKSPLDLSPSGYAWDAQPPSGEVALPGEPGEA
jgi:hypothetical protein